MVHRSSNYLRSLACMALIFCFDNFTWAKIDFNRQIRPILSDKCYKCHGPDAKNQKSDFRLDTFEHAIQEHNGFVGLTPGSLEDSEIHWRIHTDDEIELMPPPESKHPLTEEEKKLLDQWIMEGGEYEKHWSFQPLPSSVKAPDSKHPNPRNEIDHFIAEGLKDTPLLPSKEVDKARWLRRASFDLTGLPPTMEELDAFVSDTSSDAYEKVTDRLLSTNAYAERMATEWMDVARYSDSYGYQVDRPRNVWAWRDWVIRSFAQNQPYDQFVTEQLAGDLLPNATRDQILATCFNRLHSQKVEGGSVPEEFRVEYVADRVHTFGTAFLGLTMECTRCHDHKYDPLTQKDYFSLSAFFNNIDEAGLYSYFTQSVPTPTLELGEIPSDQKIRDAKTHLAETRDSNLTKESFDQWKQSVSLEKLGQSRYFKSSTVPIKSLDNWSVLELKPSLWLDANDANASGPVWHDLSGNHNHAKRTGYTQLVVDQKSGLRAMLYESNQSSFHEWSELSNAKTIFWALKKTKGNNGSILTHHSLHHFHSDGDRFWHPVHAHDHVSAGTLQINGKRNRSLSYYPDSLAIISLQTTGPVTASRLGKDRNHHNLGAIVGELLIFEEHLANKDLQLVENYLLQKWKVSRQENTFGSPIAYLSFDEKNGNQYPNLADLNQSASTNANNLEVEGRFGKGIKFSGDDALSFPNEFGDFHRHQPFSFACWIKPEQLLERGVVLRRSQAWTDAASRGYELIIEKGLPSFALVHFWPGNALRVQSTQVLPVGEWSHFAVTYDGSSGADGVRLYENGLPASTTVIRDQLTREITGGGSPFLAFGERMRDTGFKNGLLDEFYLYDRILGESEIAVLAGLKECLTQEDEYLVFLQTAHPPAMKAEIALLNARKAYGQTRQKIPEIMVMREMPGKRETHILDRGLYSEPTEVVDRQPPEVLPVMKKEFPLNRLGLARWLTEEDHPLFARVTINRYWQMIFGRGLVSTSEDFGSQGKPPSHPELLDWLARDFIDSGWNLHHLLKKMVLSATYRQSSTISTLAREKDPENLLLARGPSYRWPAEMIRDSALAYSGLLNPRVGGPSVRPYDLSVSFKPSRTDQAPDIYRRSLYTHWQRTAPSPMMMAFDSSKKDVCMVRRERTDSAAQSLVLLNGPQFVEASRATARNLIQKHGTQADVPLCRDAFRQLTSRHPEPEEERVILKLLQGQKQFYSDDNQTRDFLSVGQLKVDTKDPTYLAAVTSLVSTLMNFDESISKR